MKKYFVPHEENEYKPHLLRPKTVIFFCMVVLVVEGMFLFGSSVLAPRSKLFGIILTNVLVDETNQARIADNLPTLHENPLLDVAAQNKANDMVANNYFAHTSPLGLSPWYWFVKAGYNFSAAGENLAVDFTDSADVTSAWLNSPEHRANILDAGFTDIGMATAQGEFQGHPAIYVVELFGTPAPSISVAPIAEATTPPTSTKGPIAKSVLKSIPESVPVVFVSSSPNFVEVKGATTQIIAPATGTPAILPVAQTEETNIVQKAAANPLRVVDYFFFSLAALFIIALIINIFVKIHIQHPELIFGGMLVIIVAGLFIVLNQHFAVSGTAIL